jgi:hypothetical protein
VTVTFQKRQKEMKRLEKQRAKAEKRAQKKEAKRAAKEADATTPVDFGSSSEPQPQPGEDATPNDEKL